MMRSELIRQLAALPEDTLIGVQIGDQHVDAAALMPWGDEGFVDILCYAPDIAEVLMGVVAPARPSTLRVLEAMAKTYSHASPEVTGITLGSSR